MFSHQGGKRKELKHIHEFEPRKFKTMVDVFGGGGSVFLSYTKRPKIKCVYNDINKVYHDTFKAVADGVESAKKLHSDIQQFDIKTEEDLHKVQEAYKRNPSPVLYHVILRHVMRGIPTCKHLNLVKNKKTGKNEQKLNKLPNFMEYCPIFEGKKHEITNEDYKKVLEKYKNDPDAFLYMDPPYVTRRVSNFYDNVDLDYIGHIHEFMKTCKCKVMLHIDFTGSNYLLFKDQMKTMYALVYGMNQVRKGYTQKDKSHHMIVTNY